MTAAQRRKTVRKLPVYLFLLLFFVIAFFPVFFTFMSSFKSNMEILTTANSIFPKQFVVDNYATAWQMADFSTYTKKRQDFIFTLYCFGIR